MHSSTQQMDLVNSIGALKGKRVLIVGDVMLDHYLEGPVERISPEAPVPVVTVSRERYLLGGAGNVASNIRSLGGEPRLVCVSGSDPVSLQLEAMLSEHNLPVNMVCADDRRTTVKTRVISQNQQIVRIDRETPHSLSKGVLDQLEEQFRAHLPSHDVVIISDYGKGVVCSAMLKRLHLVSDELGLAPKILVDPKIRNFSLYKGVHLLTPNTKEAGEGAGLHEMNGREAVLKAGLAIFKKLRCEHLLITLGARGMALFEAPDMVWHIPTTAQDVFDVTGAGDTVIATIGLALAAGLDHTTASMIANYAAGLVVGEIGTASVTPDELTSALRKLPPPTVTRWI